MLERDGARALHIVEAHSRDEADVARNEWQHAWREEAKQPRAKAQCERDRRLLHHPRSDRSMADVSDVSPGVIGPVLRHCSTPFRSMRKVEGTPTVRNCVEIRSSGSRHTGNDIWKSFMNPRI